MRNHVINNCDVIAQLVARPLCKQKVVRLSLGLMHYICGLLYKFAVFPRIFILQSERRWAAAIPKHTVAPWSAAFGGSLRMLNKQAVYNHSGRKTCHQTKPKINYWWLYLSSFIHQVSLESTPDRNQGRKFYQSQVTNQTNNFVWFGLVACFATGMVIYSRLIKPPGRTALLYV